MTMSPSSRIVDPNANNRASRLKIKKESHPIQKPSSPATSSTCSSSTSTTRNQPLIIYTSSPKIIHTEPRDFMALVQKLTGLSHVTMTNTHVNNNNDDITNNNNDQSKYNGNNNVNVGDGQLTCSSISSNSFSPNSEAVSPPPPPPPSPPLVAAVTMGGFDQLENSYFLYPELTEMVPPGGWTHPGFGYGDQQDLF